MQSRCNTYNPVKHASVHCQLSYYWNETLACHISSASDRHAGLLRALVVIGVFLYPTTVASHSCSPEWLGIGCRQSSSSAYMLGQDRPSCMLDCKLALYHVLFHQEHSSLCQCSVGYLERYSYMYTMSTAVGLQAAEAAAQKAQQEAAAARAEVENEARAAAQAQQEKETKAAAQAQQENEARAAAQAQQRQQVLCFAMS